MSITADSKRLSWLLRHGATDEGLTIDAAGWVPVAEVLQHLSMERDALEEAVRLNAKRRLEFDPGRGRIRACQGHSLENRAVTREGLEGSWRVFQGTASLWHGTALEVVEPIAKEGLRAQARTHVHLASSPESRVGKRAHVHLLLEVSPARLRAEGFDVFEAPNGVILVREVPVAAIVGGRPVSRRARAQWSEVARRFGFDSR